MNARGIAALAGGAALVGGTIWLLVDRHATPTAVVSFAGRAVEATFGDVDPVTPWELELTLDRPFHAYVFTHHPIDGAVCMFPPPGLRTSLPSPLPAGTHRLPGSVDGTEVSWPGPMSVGATDIVVLLSLDRVEELDAAMDRMRVVSNSVFPDRAHALITYPDGASEDDLAPRSTWPTPLLAAAAAQASTDHCFRPLDHHPGIWCWSWKVVVRQAPSLDDQLEQSFGPLDPDANGPDATRPDGNGPDANGGKQPKATPPRAPR